VVYGDTRENTRRTAHHYTQPPPYTPNPRQGSGGGDDGGGGGYSFGGALADTDPPLHLQVLHIVAHWKATSDGGGRVDSK
jgi:hypothetical protein